MRLSRCSLFTAASRMILITPSALFHQFRWGGNDLISMGRPLDGAPIDTNFRSLKFTHSEGFTVASLDTQCIMIDSNLERGRYIIRVG